MLQSTILCVLAGLSAAAATAADDAPWWNPRWQFRTTVTRSAPDRDDRAGPVEVAVDFARLIQCAGLTGQVDPVSLRVVARGAAPGSEPVPFAWRTECSAVENRQQAYLAWFARPRVGQCGAYDIYFNTIQGAVEPVRYPAGALPPENLLANPGFEEAAGGLPAAWEVHPAALVRLGRFAQTSARQSLAIVVDENTPADADREVRIAQKIDVRPFAGQEMVFECDLLAERAAYGAPVSIELLQYRADGSPILERAVDPRWLTIELAEGQLVQFCERGRFSQEAATVEVRVRVRCFVRDADTGRNVTGRESFFTVWLDRLVVRPGERWPWPGASGAGFVEGALEAAPVNRAFQFTGQRRLALNGASEGTLTAGVADPGPRSVHWGLQAGTLEFWCRPSWDAADGVEHVFWEAVAYGHRRQSLLRKLGASEGNQFEFVIADAGASLHAVRGPAPLRAGRWHHLAATWDFPKAHLQLFVDGALIGSVGPGPTPWPSSLTAAGDASGPGMGISETDRRSMPMQAFLGGSSHFRAEGSAEAAIDELRISDTARYKSPSAPPRREFEVDEHTRALFHFENQADGVHDGDDRFVRGHLCNELAPQEETVPLEVFNQGRIERRTVRVKPHAAASQFEANRAENRLTVTRPARELPDPRFVEFRPRQVERVVDGKEDSFVLTVGGDFEPLMRCVTYAHAGGVAAATTTLPHWRAKDNVVPLSVESLRATLGAKAANDADKAFEVFKYALAVTNYYDGGYCETLPSLHRPRTSYTLLKALNIYPFDQCGPLNHTLRKMFLAVGISSNDASGTHHQFQQAFYQGSWRLFDLSSRVFWLNRDNATVVGRRGVEEDPYLKIRQGGDVCAWLRGRTSGAGFGVAERPHCMEFRLRPGEQASLCWHNEGRWFELTGQREPIPLAKIPPMFGNGAIIYEPATGEATAMDNLVLEPTQGAPAVLRAHDPSEPGWLIYRAACPYIFSDALVRGQYAAREAGAVRLALSFDEGKTWNEVWRSPDKEGTIAVGLHDGVMARYAYWLKLELAAGQTAQVKGFQVRSTLVVSSLALPGKLSRGENRITFVGGVPSVPVKTACGWVERWKTDLGVSLNALSFYTQDDQTHRNVFVASAGGALQVCVTLQGRPGRAEVWLEGLPDSWTCTPDRAAVALPEAGTLARAEFAVQTGTARTGDIRAFTVVVSQGENCRRVPAQVLVADVPLVREAEQADQLSGAMDLRRLGELSGGGGVEFEGDGTLAFDFTAPREGGYALWLRARWAPESSTRMVLAVDGGKPREVRASAMIGFSDWTDPREAHTKMFAHFGQQYGQWAWYRIPEVALGPGKHRLAIAASKGACLDTLVVLPQNDAMDRAAMNLFHNWNFGPWENPF